MRSLDSNADKYSGFNLIIGDVSHLFYYSNRKDENSYTPLPAGIYGLSNHSLNTPWRKVLNGRSALAKEVVAKEHINIENIFAILSMKEQAADHELPDTGIGIYWGKILSSIFINTNVTAFVHLMSLLLIKKIKLKLRKNSLRATNNFHPHGRLSFVFSLVTDCVARTD